MAAPSPPAAAAVAPPRRARSPLVLSLALLLVGITAVSLTYFFRTELSLEHYYHRAAAWTTGTGTGHAETLEASLGDPAPPATPTPTPSPSPPPAVDEDPHPVPDYDVRNASHGDLGADYECLRWRRTGDSSPDGPLEPVHSRNCSQSVQGGASGYCLFRHKATGELRRWMAQRANALLPKDSFRCDMAPALVLYAPRSLAYEHDPRFSSAHNRAQLTRALPAPTRARLPETFFRRAVVMVVYEKLLFGAFVSIRSLRAMGCTLPVEMWYRRDETDPDHAFLKKLRADYGVYLREITDPNATSFYTKLYAVFYSAFDNILLLDADNFAVRDPTYLFETPEFTSTGAMFWPDYWNPHFTMFNLHADSLAWQIFGLPFVDMFEQESGQVLIDRKRHMRALNVLMYYGFSLPRVHQELGLVWGDKDLFRFAWMKTNSSFHFIEQPAGAAGHFNATTGRFCGGTMVQADPTREIIFLHRNNVKLSPKTMRLIWTHIEQFNVSHPRDDYDLHYSHEAIGPIEHCYGKNFNWAPAFVVEPVEAFAFRDLESRLLKYGKEIERLAPKPHI